MAPIDIIIIAFLLVCALIGYREGLIRSSCSLIAGVVGVALAIGIIQLFPSLTRAHPLGARIIILLVSISLVSLVMIPLARKLEQLRSGREGADQTLGALMRLGFGLVMVWLLAAMVSVVPNFASNQLNHRSVIVRSLDHLVSPQPIITEVKQLRQHLSSDVTVSIPIPQIHPPSNTIKSQAGVIAASSRAVKIVSDACDYRLSGSGWLIENNEVVTNEHVIAGSSQSVVTAPGQAPVTGHVIYADPVQDLALIQLNQPLKVQPLQLTFTTHQGQTGALLSYPGGGQFKVTPVRFGDTATELIPSPDGQEHLRLTTTVRGMVKAGDSGGPIVDANGQVVAIIFARSIGGKVKGGFAIPSSVVRSALLAPVVPAGQRAVTSCLSTG